MISAPIEAWKCNLSYRKLLWEDRRTNQPTNKQTNMRVHTSNNENSKNRFAFIHLESLAENRERIAKGWDRKRIGNGQQTDR